MNEKDCKKLLFIINPGSGNNDIDWTNQITQYFSATQYEIEFYDLPADCDLQKIKDKIIDFMPQQVIAVGGDGTVKLVAECLIQKNIPLGILPAGSANGLAKELGISNNPLDALDVLVNGNVKKVHVIKINNELCIHLSDIGFNAFVIKMFEAQTGRGMWGYIKASVKALWSHPHMMIEMQLLDKKIKLKVAMVVIANATQYGSGAVINPIGKLDDDVFEVIAVKKISFREIFKMMISHAPYDTEKTEIFQTKTLSIRSRKKAHFQVDGEYLGKVNEVNASIITDALEIIVPFNKIVGA